MTAPPTVVITYDPSQLPEIDAEGLSDEEKHAHLQEASAAMHAAIFNAPKVTPGSKAEQISNARRDKAIAFAMAWTRAVQS
ncbi:hypothetical protein ASH00_15830 [Arthrobacter sp. Soil782]|uniref:hypothetical protein n=1 Tax=Arthrobacter sp. Soil782 TaxID=1736410 RepID=UPI0006FD7AEC|nr:hypothetical protein [Arthrobacter sp. Soil782]KRF03254.1 hypothetical protein ASH00_15830 [Arthrobacter sp. Soil782]